MWRAIDSLPKGTPALLAWADGVVRIGQRYADLEWAFKCELDFGDFSSSCYAPRDYLPTRWMPLPDAVTDKTE